MDDNLWLIELESALLDDCTVNEIYAICRGKAIPESLRPDVWQVCLDVRHKNDQMCLFNEIYDLPFQKPLREDCQKAVDNLGNEDEDKVSVLSDLESIFTFYCKNRSFQYESENGWIELLMPLLSLKLKRSDTYNLFEAIRDTYIPKGCVAKGNVFNVFRLLILYHDPELCSMLDTRKISPDIYSIAWFQSLFASTCGFSVVLSMWDLYFQHNDPYLVFFLALIILINGREQILALKNESKEVIVKFLTNMPCALETDDVVDFCSLAQYYALKTPSSFKTDFLKSLFGSSHDSDVDRTVFQALCLPVSVYELVETSSMELTTPDSVRFFLVDCRPADHYNAGHLSTAFHLDCNLMLQEPSAFALAVQGLLRAQKHSIDANSHAGGEHLCFMGSGRLEEDQFTHMVVASFLQKNTQYVSLLTGGYNSIHDYFGEHMADCLEDHDVKKCLVCLRNSAIGTSQTKTSNNNSSRARNNNPSSSNSDGGPEKSSNDFFGKISAAMNRGKGKLLDIIVNPSAAGNQGQQMIAEKHVSSSEKNGKRYRNVAPVFSIDDENDDQADGESFEDQNPAPATGGEEIVNLNQYLKSPDCINSFQCQEVHMNGFMYDSHLIVTQTHLVVLRELSKRGTAKVIVRRPLSSIVKITAKKRHRDLITFKYGILDGEQLVITDMDRFLIPNANEATAIVSQHIVHQLNNTRVS